MKVAQKAKQPTHPWKKFVEHPPLRDKFRQPDSKAMPNWKFRVIPR